MASTFMPEEESLADLAARIHGKDRELYSGFKYLKIEAAFDGRIFVLYKPCGLLSSNEHREPDILTTVRIISFSCSSSSGATIRVKDDVTGEEMDIGYVPKRLFNYDVFMSVPPRMQLRWDARNVAGVVRRTMSYPVLVKTKNRSDWYSAGVTYCETPNSYRDLFPKSSASFF